MAGEPTPRVARVRVVLPLPPSFNKTWKPFAFMDRGRPAARIILSREAKEWQATAAAVLARVRRVPALASPSAVLCIELIVYVESVSSDGTNRVKLVEDALAKSGLTHNDRGNVVVRVVKRIDASNPRVEVDIREADRIEHAEVAWRLEASEREAKKREAAEATGSLFPEAVDAPGRPPAYRTPSPSTETYGKRHGLDKLRAKARPASYPRGRGGP